MRDIREFDLRELRVDPVREDLGERGAVPTLDWILTLFPRTEGEPAFDEEVIRRKVDRLRTSPEVNTGHPLLDESVRRGLASIDAAFQGNHPKYGVKQYAEEAHDGFPPTIIAAVDALSAWGMYGRAAEIFRYWLINFVKPNGWVKYRGTSIAELGQILHTAASLEERAGPTGWWEDGFAALEAIAGNLMRLRAAAGMDGLLVGSPEDDERDKRGRYFHNNLWAAKGLVRWAEVCERRNTNPWPPIGLLRALGEVIEVSTLLLIEQTWPMDEGDWWLTPQLEPCERPESLTGTRLASYTNYRYWPELLSSGMLPATMANRIVEARLSAGGQFCGMTRFAGHLDDWPLAEYLFGLWSLGRKSDFLLSLYGHVAYHQAEGHLTAYEQVSFPPGKKKADYCLPCQLVAARGARMLQV